MSSDKHTSLIKTPRQLITVVILAFLVPVVLIILLATFVAGQKVGGAGSDAMTPEAIAERLRPVGAVAFAGAPAGPRTSQGGEAVYKLACSACHATGAAGAPKAGDNSAWAPRIKQGFDTLVKHAVEGYKGMPAKGGNPDLDPIEVARAVAYIANQSGAKFKEPEAPAAATAKSSARSGEQIVRATCGNCHNAGLNGAPKIGDRAAWTKRVVQWRRCRHRRSDQRPRRHAGARRNGRSHRCGTQVGGAVHVLAVGRRRRNRRHCGCTAVRLRRADDAGGQAGRREGLLDGVQRLPRDGRRRCAEVW